MSDPFYRTAEWRRLRAIVLARDPVCRTPRCGRPSSHVDHVTPRREGGSDDPLNLRGLCESCHNRRTADGNGRLRAIGCDAAGLPLDGAHAFFVGEESLSTLGGNRAPGRTRSKFRERK